MVRVALRKARLELLRVGGEECREKLGGKSLEDTAEGIIVGTGSHWFGLRKLRTPSSGGRMDWYNVDSCLLRGPLCLPQSLLAAYLDSFAQRGYSLFLVSGTYPLSADLQDPKDCIPGRGYWFDANKAGVASLEDASNSGGTRKMAAGKPKAGVGGIADNVNGARDFLSRGFLLIVQGNERDRASDLRGTLEYYRKGIQLLLKGLGAGEAGRGAKKAKISRTVAEYMERAEKIKRYLDSLDGSGLPSSGVEGIEKDGNGIQETDSNDGAAAVSSSSSSLPAAAAAAAAATEAAVATTTDSEPSAPPPPPSYEDAIGLPSPRIEGGEVEMGATEEEDDVLKRWKTLRL